MIDVVVPTDSNIEQKMYEKLEIPGTEERACQGRSIYDIETPTGETCSTDSMEKQQDPQSKEQCSAKS